MPEKTEVKTRVVNLRKEPFDIYIGRAGHGYDGYYGNPFFEGDRKTLIARYKEYFLKKVAADPVFRQRILELRGMRLGCFCAPSACHGDVIVEWLEHNEQ